MSTVFFLDVLFFYIPYIQNLPRIGVWKGRARDVMRCVLDVSSDQHLSTPSTSGKESVSQKLGSGINSGVDCVGQTLTGIKSSQSCEHFGKSHAEQVDFFHVHAKKVKWWLLHRALSSSRQSPTRGSLRVYLTGFIRTVPPLREVALFLVCHERRRNCKRRDSSQQGTVQERTRFFPFSCTCLP